MSEYRHFENIEHCVSDLVGREPEELADCCIPRRYSAGGRFLRQGSQNVPQKLVTDGHRRFGILSAVPGFTMPHSVVLMVNSSGRRNGLNIPCMSSRTRCSFNMPVRRFWARHIRS